MSLQARKIRLIMNLRRAGITDTRVLAALERVPREQFVLPNFHDQAYEDQALPIAQGDFRVYAYLGDEKAVHVHDLRILRPGFTVVSPDYFVGLIKPAHAWSLPDSEPAAAVPLGRAVSPS